MLKVRQEGIGSIVEFGCGLGYYTEMLAANTHARVVDVNVAGTLDALVVIYFVQGKLAEATPLAQRALSIYELRVGKNARELVSPIKMLGAIDLMKGDLDKSEPLLKRAVKLSRKFFGKRHTEIAKQLGNLGALCMAREKPAKARRYFEEALTIWGENPDPVYGVMTMVNLAKVHANDGDRDRADSLFRKALALREQAFGQDHPQTRNIADSYAEFQKKAGISGKP
ncbi:MAG: tetratricopeptide repeat protein [Elusimicrobia bacterium]|nr:tetratricopeptide repeat protein [Elusimicrobiota bacterium]